MGHRSNKFHIGYSTDQEGTGSLLSAAALHSLAGVNLPNVEGYAGKEEHNMGTWVGTIYSLTILSIQYHAFV